MNILLILYLKLIAQFGSCYFFFFYADFWVKLPTPVTCVVPTWLLLSTWTLLCLYFEKIMTPVVIIHELNATDCDRVCCLLFLSPPESSTNKPTLNMITAGCRTSHTGLIVHVKMNIAVMRASILPCTDQWNSLRAVLIRACAISHFFPN